MTEDQRKQRNAEKLAELFPAFRKKIKAVIADLESQGQRPRIQAGWRSPEDQLAAFLSGNSKLKFGFHNVTSIDGAKESLAVDMLDDNLPLNPTRNYLLRLAAAAEQQGLTTGIRWGLSPNLHRAIDQALAAKNYNAPVKVGWDPTHVEPTDLTPTEAKSGKRPQ